MATRALAGPHGGGDSPKGLFVASPRRHAPDAPYAGAWLHAAAAHAALNVVRGRQRRARREAAQAGASDRLRGHAERQLDPQCALEDGEQRREVRAALSRLPARSAAVLALRYSGLSYAEVAAALGVGVGQVGTMLRRAEAALRKEITNATSQ